MVPILKKGRKERQESTNMHLKMMHDAVKQREICSIYPGGDTLCQAEWHHHFLLIECSMQFLTDFISPCHKLTYFIILSPCSADTVYGG